LLPSELHHAAALLLDEATRLGVLVLPSMQEGGLAWTLITRPETARNPVTPEPGDLRPHPTGVPEWQLRETALATLLDTAPSLHEAYAALLLLHVNARDRQANMPVLLLLELTATLLIGLNLAKSEILSNSPRQLNLERQPLMHIQREGAVGIDVLPLQRRQRPQVHRG
jgi:hypothetical protein